MIFVPQIYISIVGVRVSLSLCERVEMEHNHVFLTPFNYLEWKAKMEIQLRSRGIYRVPVGTMNDPNSAMEKSKYFNRLDEAFRMFVSVSQWIFSSI